MGRRRLLLLLLPFAALLGVLVLSVGTGDAGKAQGYEALFDRCRDTDCVVGVLRLAFDDLGPRGALAAYTDTNPDSGSGVDCHGALHELGGWAWEEYGVDAWFPYRAACNYGYYHGLMVAVADSSTLDAFTETAHLLCETQALPDDILPGRECAHGFGHAVIHLTASVGDAVSRCGAFTDGRFRRRCVEGIAKDIRSVDRFVDGEDFAECPSWPSESVPVCVYITAAYAVIRAPQETLRQMPSFCEAQPEGVLRDECFAGLGRGVAMKAVGENQQTPGVWAVDVCSDSQACAEGFGRSIFYIRNSREWSLAECERLDAGLRFACREGVEFIAADP